MNSSRSKNIVRLIMFCLLLLFGLLIFRLVQLQIFQHDFYQTRVAAQVRKTIDLPARRGNIYDRNALLLATNIDRYTLYVNCAQVRDKKALAINLAALLDDSSGDIYYKIADTKSVVQIRRDIEPSLMEQINSQNLPGVFMIREQRRFYLRDSLASHVLGFVSRENAGMGGVEHTMDRYLQGIAGSLIVEADSFGKEIYSGRRIIQEARDGNDIYLTIDEFLQYIAKKSLKAAIEKYNADGGTVIAMDVVNGDVLAMVSLPDYDPNNFWRYRDDRRINNNVQTVYEPGSVFKLITVAAALDSGKVQTDYSFVNDNEYEFGGRRIREAEKLKEPLKPRFLRDILIESLNIGSAKLAILVGKNTLYEYIERFGFGKRVGVDLAGESAGISRVPDSWSRFDEAVIGFGHAISVTPLQMLAAGNAIANDGIYVQPKLISKLVNCHGELLPDYKPNIKKQRIISADIARVIRTMMIASVDEHTFNARLNGYSIAGKTGTSQKVDPKNGGYLRNQYMSSFLGFIPGNRPRVSILVVIDNPKGKYFYGGATAAPVFRDIAAETVRYLAIPPDL